MCFKERGLREREGYEITRINLKLHSYYSIEMLILMCFFFHEKGFKGKREHHIFLGFLSISQQLEIQFQKSVYLFFYCLLNLLVLKRSKLGNDEF